MIRKSTLLSLIFTSHKSRGFFAFLSSHLDEGLTSPLPPLYSSNQLFWRLREIPFLLRLICQNLLVILPFSPLLPACMNVTFSFYPCFLPILVRPSILVISSPCVISDVFSLVFYSSLATPFRSRTKFPPFQRVLVKRAFRY